MSNNNVILWSASEKHRRVCVAIKNFMKPGSLLTRSEAAETALTKEEVDSGRKSDLISSIVNCMNYHHNEIPTKTHGSTALTAEQEKSVILTLSSFNICGKPVSPSFVIDCVRERFHLDSSWNGWVWWRHFKGRYKDDVDVNAVERIANRRLEPSQMEEVPAFCDKLESVLYRSGPYSLEMKCPPHAIFNIDETIVGVSCGNLHLRAITTPERHCGVISYHHGESLGSCVVCVSADGKLTFAIVILKSSGDVNDQMEAKYNGPILALLKTRLRGDPSIYFAFNSTGMLNSELWVDVIQKFVQYRDRIMPGMDCLLFLDNLASHRAMRAVQIATENRVRLFFLIRNCSHWLQPLDQWILLQFKQAIHLHLKSAILNINNLHEWKSNLLDVIPRALIKACTPELIKKSFEDTGLYPYNRRKIFENANRNIGASKTTSPLESDAVALCEDIVRRIVANSKPTHLEEDNLSVKVHVNKVYDGYELHTVQMRLNEQKERDEKEKQANKIEKEAEKERKRLQKEEHCRQVEENRKKRRMDSEKKAVRGSCQSCHKRRTKKSVNWRECTHCLCFSVCGECNGKSQNDIDMAQHEAKCRMKVTK